MANCIDFEYALDNIIWEANGINISGVEINTTNSVRSNFINVYGNLTINCIINPNNLIMPSESSDDYLYEFRIYQYNSNKEYIKIHRKRFNSNNNIEYTIDTLDQCSFIRFDFCVEYNDSSLKQYYGITLDPVDFSNILTAKIINMVNFDKSYSINDFTQGTVLKYDGSETLNDNYYISDYIPVIPKSTIICNLKIGGSVDAANGAAICGYDIYKQYKTYLFANADNLITNYTKLSINIPDDIYYIKYTTRYIENASINIKYATYLPQEIYTNIYEQLGERLINISEFSTGKIIYSAGGIDTNENYYYLENIPVLPHQKIIFNAYFGGGETNSGGISGYDKDGAFLCRVFDGVINGNANTNRTNYINKEWEIPDNVYYICFSTRADGTTTPYLLIKKVDYDCLRSNLINISSSSNNDLSSIYENEIKTTVEAVQAIYSENNTILPTFAFISDIHHDPKYGINDTLNDTIFCLNELNKRLNFDAIFNLGDSIDGQYQDQYDAEACLSEVRFGMQSIIDDMHILEGNHDDNYQSTWDTRGGRASDHRLTNLELFNLINRGIHNENHGSNKFTNYYIDYDNYNIRFICLAVSYTTYSADTENYLTNILNNSQGKRVIILSHCPTRPEWSCYNDVSNGTAIETAILDFIDGGGTVLAFIHGHIHGDQTQIVDGKFTEISINCAKCEKFIANEYSTGWDRSSSDYTKVSIDIVIILNDKIHFIRCGAGNDRNINII